MNTKIPRRTAVLTAAVGLVATRARAQATAPTVDTKFGKLRGAISGDGVRSFKGIPYAASTAGTARFLPPSAPTPWPGIRDATSFGGSAPQLPASGDPLGAWYTALQPLSEDCLSLNVWTTDSAGKREAGGARQSAYLRIQPPRQLPVVLS